ncbi:Pre-mRNA-processing factor 19 2 [Phytophthora rubi]|uniref:Pre-mRNA-processing factor 19 n=1 Tax=Phytophthora rubi TaxID=129364 RepID=A0A6A4FB11_9STRA|nr:Pre-mRNA-processing factor 19 2 [Phytophthora rubi]KAE9013100.1 Pre-mRNA-processing factor 19 2 [Phytophthora rubi]KAE9331830.1 Pre-mRNA-processing factor 19 2 [Phytophthora rubi]
MLCSLSGQVPVEPVVSLKSGLVFERRLLLKYLEQNQRRCPVTGEELDADKDLLALRAAPTASKAAAGAASASPLAALSPEAASVPQLLAAFQNEWDAVMLETFTLKQHLEQTRQELSHALYQHDAACRVIARLNAENAALKERAAQLAAGEQADVDMGADASPAGAALAPEVLANVEAKQKELAKRRKDFKKKDGPQRAALLSGLADWKAASSHTLHDSDKPGVTCVAVDSKRPTLVATGGVDKHAKIFDTDKQQLVATLTGHAKKLSHVEFHPSADMVLTASHDKTVKLWTPQDEGYGVGYTLDGFDDAVSSSSIHPTGSYVLSGSLDATWAIHDVRRGQLLSRYTLNGELAMPDAAAGKPKKAANEVRCARFHPDGGIFGTAAKSKLVQMWAVNSLSNVVTFEGHTAPVTALGFSENGYHLASGSEDGVVKLWDLRKATSFFELDLKKEQPQLKLGVIHSVNFDASGSHLAVASAQAVQVLKEVSKNRWEVVKTFSDHKAAVTGVQFAPDSSFLASTSMDRSLKIYR